MQNCLLRYPLTTALQRLTVWSSDIEPSEVTKESAGVYNTIYGAAAHGTVTVIAERPTGDNITWNGSSSSQWYRVSKDNGDQIPLFEIEGKPLVNAHRTEPLVINKTIDMDNPSINSFEIITSLVNETSGEKNNIVIRVRQDVN